MDQAMDRVWSYRRFQSVEGQWVLNLLARWLMQVAQDQQDKC